MKQAQCEPSPSAEDHQGRGEGACSDKSPFSGLVKHAGYLSPWESDVVQIDMAGDRHRDVNGTYDLTKTYIQTSGPLSIFQGVRPITDFPELVVTCKALLNTLSATFSTSSKRRSEITQNFNNVLRFFCWMLQQKGIYRISDVTRDLYREFMLQMKATGGWASLLGVDGHLKSIIADLDRGVLTIGEVCPSSANTDESRVRIGVEFLAKRIGIPMGLQQVPRWFFDELKRFHTRKVRSDKGRESDFSYMSAYSHIKSLNRLAEIPTSAGGSAFLPFPDGYDLARDLSDTTNDRYGGKTANLHVEDAVLLFSEALRWMYEYADGVVAIGGAIRTTLELAASERDSGIHRSVRQNERLGLDLAETVDKLCRSYRLPFEAVVLSAHSERYDEQKRPDIRQLFNLLQTACFIMVAVNHGRRKNESAGENNLPYGLYFGCIQPDADNPLINMIDVYIEKTVKDWRRFYVNTLVAKAVSVLEALAQIMRPLNSKPLGLEATLPLSRKNKLFRFRPMTEAGFLGQPQSYRFSSAGPYFFRRAGTSVAALDHRAHPFRRFFSLIYYHRYDNAQLIALSAHLVHLDVGMTEVYVRDPKMRTENDRIEKLYGRKGQGSGPTDDLVEVRTEMFQDLVLKILTGEKPGGEWPRLVVASYKHMSDHVDFVGMSKAEQARALGARLLAEGYQRSAFEHCGCNVGTNEITATKSNCARGPDRRPQLEMATPELCFGCVHRDCNEAHLLTLTARLHGLEQVAGDMTAPPAVRVAAEKEHITLAELIHAERMIGVENRKMIAAAVEGFAVAFGEVRAEVSV